MLFMHCKSKIKIYHYMLFEICVVHRTATVFLWVVFNEVVCSASYAVRYDGIETVSMTSSHVKKLEVTNEDV